MLSGLVQDDLPENGQGTPATGHGGWTSATGKSVHSTVASSATIATHARFKQGKQVASYLGLAPTVHQSGETHYHGRIRKKGDKLPRWLLIEAAGAMLTRSKVNFPLRQWGLDLTKAKGNAEAKVAVARRLAVLLFTLWKEGKDLQSQPA